jgi:hypothetical protein
VLKCLFAIAKNSSESLTFQPTFGHVDGSGLGETQVGSATAKCEVSTGVGDHCPTRTHLHAS